MWKVYRWSTYYLTLLVHIYICVERRAHALDQYSAARHITWMDHVNAQRYGGLLCLQFALNLYVARLVRLTRECNKVTLLRDAFTPVHAHAVDFHDTMKSPSSNALNGTRGLHKFAYFDAGPLRPSKTLSVLRYQPL